MTGTVTYPLFGRGGLMRSIHERHKETISYANNSLQVLAALWAFRCYPSRGIRYNKRKLQIIINGVCRKSDEE
jgi:hypothetical protein